MRELTDQEIKGKLDDLMATAAPYVAELERRGWTVDCKVARGTNAHGIDFFYSVSSATKKLRLYSNLTP